MKSTPAPLIHYTLCVRLRVMFMHIPMGDLRCSSDVNFEIFNLSFEPEDKIKMGSCLWGVYGVFNALSDDVLIVKIPHVDQKLWFFWNNKLWISVSRQLMTSSWRNNFCIIYWLLSTCVQSFNLMQASHFFLRTIDTEKNKKKKEKTEKKNEQN